MRFVAFDVETTGLSSHRNQVIEIGAVIADTLNLTIPTEKLPTFHCYVKHDEMAWHIVALKMNWDLMKIILFDNPPNLYGPAEAMQKFREFLAANDLGNMKLTFAGKNFAGFDKLFLENMAANAPRLHHRALDPAMPFFNWKMDNELPGLYECARRAGLKLDGDKHRAVDDARIVVDLLRSHWTNDTFDTWVRSQP